MAPHGPDVTTYEKAIDPDSSGPQKIPENTLAFMFEVNATPRVTPAALSSPCIDC
ncbi:MAG: homogentisate 1,2-dioxygenase, partial [Oscillatoriales cyanobacterium RU_3_3]|nr:homogentisate 1,2-dioxygenase [Oscillatoriales cyanobacterium RU_3_3]